MRIIIDNRSHLSDTQAVARVHTHMQQTSESDSEYLKRAAYWSNVFVWYERNKCSHRFVVCAYPKRLK